MTSRTVWGFLVLTTGVACGGSPGGTPDADSHLPLPDGGNPADLGTSVLAVDFTASGCATLDLTPRCAGIAPLAVTFIPIQTETITQYLWDFGDGSTRSRERTPSHSYTLPGDYDVTLVAGDDRGSTVMRIRTGFIGVTANRIGDPCDVDSQCEPGLTCACGSAARCPAAFARGFCTSACDKTTCGSKVTCVDLTAGGDPVTPPEFWRGPLCLHNCDLDKDCPAGLRCRDLPARGMLGPWVLACLAPVLSDLGGSCRAASGQLQNNQCTSGLCAEMGAQGMCTLACDKNSCPLGSACAQFASGSRLCLRSCSATFGCSDDPLLSCQIPNPGGPLGFSLQGGMAGATYCSPKRCTTAADCGAGGDCAAGPDGAQCIRKSG